MGIVVKQTNDSTEEDKLFPHYILYWEEQWGTNVWHKIENHSILVSESLLSFQGFPESSKEKYNFGNSWVRSEKQEQLLCVL